MTPIDNISCNLDPEVDGKQFGSIDLAYSDNENAFAKIPIPLVIIKNGDGPTLLLSAGNHGNEYEGQAILRRLAHDLSPADIEGRLILLPALNYPAVLDDARVSPLDNGNMNRLFPGIAGGTPTSAIADFVTRELLPLADAGVDLHSGGDSACFLPCGFLCTAAEPAVTARNLALAESFDAPHTFVVDGANAQSGFDPVANRLGIPFISAELGGGGGIDPGCVEIGLNGINNLMRSLGIMPAHAAAPRATRFLDGIDGAEYLSAPWSGIFEPYRELGEEVAEGEVAGRLYSLEEVEREPLELVFPRAGTLLVRRSRAQVRRGGHLYLVASEMSRDDVLAPR